MSTKKKKSQKEHHRKTVEKHEQNENLINRDQNLF